MAAGVSWQRERRRGWRGARPVVWPRTESARRCGPARARRPGGRPESADAPALRRFRRRRPPRCSPAPGRVVPADGPGRTPARVHDGFLRRGPVGEPRAEYGARIAAAGAPPWAGEVTGPVAGAPPPWETGPWPGPGADRASRTADGPAPTALHPAALLVTAFPPEWPGSRLRASRRHQRMVGAHRAGGRPGAASDSRPRCRGARRAPEQAR